MIDTFMSYLGNYVTQINQLGAEGGRLICLEVTGFHKQGFHGGEHSRYSVQLPWHRVWNFITSKKYLNSAAIHGQEELLSMYKSGC